ncbi:MAG: hypothetical protein COB67_09905 [SAR324 cluster bacterium]|uniref:HEAT repeat domain-containing protein n=1 Tax=SAR324 cluster bacterium TaxID=2024889 RepID=A0A2A4SZ62_9DELT|nr:MAG: hypothetical protein COB67_09905 [SAR324 cluster bacterium]
MNLRLLLLACSLLFLLSGCVTVGDIHQMENETNQDKIIENITVLNDLIKSEVNDPSILSSAMRVAVTMARKNIDLEKDAPIEYKVLVDNLRQHWQAPVALERQKDWEEKGFQVEETQYYLRAYAVNSLIKLGIKDPIKQMISVLKRLDPKDKKSDIIRIAAMEGLRLNLKKIENNANLREATLAALASVYLTSRDEKSTFMRYFNFLEDRITDLPTLNRVIQRRRILVPSQEALSYLIDLNGRLLNKYVLQKTAPEKSAIRQNINLLMALSSPYLSTDSDYFESLTEESILSLRNEAELQKEGIPTSLNRRKASITLNHHFPSAFQYAMLLSSKNSLNVLKILMRYTESVREYERETNGEKSPLQRTLSQVFPRDFRDRLQLISKRLLFESIISKVRLQKKKYRDEYYSLLYSVYPQEFAEYLSKYLSKKFRVEREKEPAAHIIEMASYAAQYAFLKNFERSRLKELYEVLFMLTKNQITYFTQKEHTEYVKTIGPFLSRIYPKRHVAMCADMSQSFKKTNSANKFKNIGLFTELCLKSLEDPKSFEINEKYWLAIGNALRLHDKVSSNLLAGFFLQRDVRVLIDLYMEHVFDLKKKDTEITWYDYYLFGQIFRKNRAELPKSYDQGVVDIFIRGIASPDDAISLSALRYAFALSRETGVRQAEVRQAVGQRWKGLQIPDFVYQPQ